MNLGLISIIAGLVCWLLLIIGVGVSIDLWVLGWLLIVLGELVLKGRSV